MNDISAFQHFIAEVAINQIIQQASENKKHDFFHKFIIFQLQLTITQLRKNDIKTQTYSYN